MSSGLVLKIFSLCCGLWCCVVSATASELSPQDIKNVVDQLNHPGGWAVNVGSTDGAVEQKMHAAGSFAVTGLAYSNDAAVVARQNLAQADLTGVITVHEVIQTERLPFPDSSIAFFVINGPELGKMVPSDEEILRTLRPHGAALILAANGSSRTLIRPADPRLDDWTHYEYNAASTMRSSDELAGPNRSLQWVTGDDKTRDRIHMRSANGIHVAVEKNGLGHFKTGAAGRLTARDAFSGVTLWQHPEGIYTGNRYSFMVDHERVYIHGFSGKYTVKNRDWEQPQFPMRSFDLRTGKPLVTYDEGLLGPGAIPPQVRKKKNPDLTHRYIHAVVEDGVIIQVRAHEMVALDAETGKRLWYYQTPGKEYLFARVSGDKVFFIRGHKRTFWRGYLPYEPTMVGEALVVRDLRSGTIVWEKDISSEEWGNVSNVAINPTHVALLRYSEDDNKGKMWGYSDKIQLYNIEDGMLLWEQHSNDKETGYRGVQKGGHFVRLAISDDRVWATGTSGTIGYLITDKTDRLTRYGTRNKNCGTSVLTANWVIGSSYFVNLDDWSKNFRSYATRGACDFGPLPANGLVYNMLGSSCRCWPFIRSTVAFNSAPFPEQPWEGERLWRTSVQPASASDSEAWPMWRATKGRGNWTNNAAPENLQTHWAMAVPHTQPPSSHYRELWGDHTQIRSPVTAPTVAGDLICVADSHGHQVVGLDAADGSERWRTIVDGRIDSAPTLYQGGVYVGTRTGWVYALNADTGAIMWRYLAAPHQRFVMAYGQAESAWPVFGTVMIHDGLIWASAGRQSAMDHGLRWYAFDPKSGEVKRSGRHAMLSKYQVYWRETGLPENHPNYGAEENNENGPWPTEGVNGPMITNGDFIAWYREGVDLKTEQPVAFGTAFKSGWSNPKNRYNGKFIDLMRPNVQAAMMQPGTGGDYMGIVAELFAFDQEDVIHFRAGTLRYSKVVTREEIKTVKGGPRIPHAEKVWAHQVPEHFMAIVRAKNALITAQGRRKNAQQTPFADELVLRSMEDGSEISSFNMPENIVYHGLAVANGSLFVTTVDGTVTCLK